VDKVDRLTSINPYVSRVKACYTLIKNRTQVRIKECEKLPKQDRSEYFKQYREKNRERINQTRNEWARENPEKVALYQMRYWMKKAEHIQAKQG
jgi:hypothetical protein